MGERIRWWVAEANRLVTDTHMGKVEKFVWLLWTAAIIPVVISAAWAPSLTAYPVDHATEVCTATQERIIHDGTWMCWPPTWLADAPWEYWGWIKVGFILLWFVWGLCRMGGFTFNRPR